MKMHLFLLIYISSFIFYKGYAQTEANPNNFAKLSDVLPPSPNAAALGKYGGINVGLNSGVVNKTLSLYDFRYREMNVPISLSYRSSGFKVDEIASRVGVGWTLNAGGVITRTIMGSPDEYGTRVAQPNTVAANQETYKFLQDASAFSYNWDTQPDIFNFNFNGYSGQFVFDVDGSIVQIAVSDLKIEKDFSSDATWNFKITTPDGNKYYFGGSDATEKTKKTSSCFYSRLSYEPTAWYLLKIESASGHYINFVYFDTYFPFFSGVIQSLYTNNPSTDDCLIGGGEPNKCPLFLSNVCNNYLASQGKYLKEISTTDGGKVNFSTIYRFDCGDVLFDQITVTDYNNIPRFIYKFDYSHIETTLFSSSFQNGITRPFLNKLIESSPNTVIKREHKFSYNNINELPVQLTMSQDHWGYFNGKLNSNLVAKPSELEQQYKFPNATANREPDYNYSKKGVLSKIQYPTGGWDSIYYEPNQYYGQKIINPEPVTKTAIVTGSGNWNEVVSETSFSTTKAQNAILTFKITATGSFDPLHNVGKVYVINQNGVQIYESAAYSPDDIDKVASIPIGGGDVFKLRVKANGSVLTTAASIVYQNASTLSIPNNIEFGGIRVSKVETYNGTTPVPEVKKYYYHQLNTPNISSAATPKTPSYFKEFKSRIGCRYNPIDDWNYQYCEHSAMFSYPLNNFITIPGGASYETVIEGYGNNFEGGAIEHRYRIREDEPASPFNTLGAYIGNSSMNNLSRYNGKELFQTTFKKNTTGVLTPVKEIETTYQDDIRRQKSIYGYVANQKYPIYMFGGPHYENQVNAFDAVTYTIGSNWEYVERIQEKIFDPVTGNWMTNIVNYSYDNAEHVQVTRTETINSKAEILRKEFKYPSNFQSALPYSTMVYRHIIKPIIEQSVFKGTSLTPYQTTKTNYVFWNGTSWSSTTSNIIVPQTIETRTAPQSIYETRLRYSTYNTFGNVTEVSKETDVKKSYLWGYHSLYPIAEVTNAKSNEVLFDSFEEDNGWGTTTWTGQGGGSYGQSISAYDNSKSYAGRKAGRIDNTTNSEIVSHSKWLYIVPVNATKFKYSGWVYSNGPVADIYLLMKKGTMDGYNSYHDHVSTSELNKWVYLEKEFSVPADVSQIAIRLDNNGNSGAGGSVWFDDIRLYPSSAQMTTYTYDPLIGMTSHTDINNKTTYYEYDDFGRLLHLRDQNKNILKKYCYNYAGQAVDCNATNGSAVYAKIKYENQYVTGSIAYGNVVLKLYTDKACTLAYNANSKPFTYNYFFPCYESPSGLPASVSVTGDSHILKSNEILSYWDSRDVFKNGSWITELFQCFTKYYLINDPGYQIVQ